MNTQKYANINECLDAHARRMGELPVLFYSNKQFQCIGWTVPHGAVGKVDPRNRMEIEGMMLARHLWADKISIAEYNDRRFYVCHG